MAKFDSSENLIAKKVVIGDQVGEETRGAKFGADPYTAASGGLKLQCELLRKKFFLQLISTKCMSLLLYHLQAFSLYNYQLKSLSMSLTDFS